MAAGVVYILRNPFLVGRAGRPLLKIGGSARSAQVRALELSAATGVPGQFSVVFETATADWQRLEALVHRSLKAQRRAGEFFEVTPQEAIATIERLKLTIPAPRAESKPHLGEPRYEDRGLVRFTPTVYGFAVKVAGRPLGELTLDATAVFYRFQGAHSPDPVIETAVIGLPRQTGAARDAAIAKAKRRVAWIACILARFTDPQLRPLPNRSGFSVHLNGLPVASLTERRERRGLIIRREEIDWDWAPLPCPSAPVLEETFGAAITITPTHEPPRPEQLFVYMPTLGLEESVRRHLLDTLFASAALSRDRWDCRVELPNSIIDVALNE